MSTLVHRVRSFIRQHALAAADTRVVAAVSGGSDSMALASVLSDLHRTGDLRFAGIAHFNHQLRPDADRDEQFVRDAAQAFSVPFVSDRDDVGARAARERRSIEDAARAARLAFLT